MQRRLMLSAVKQFLAGLIVLSIILLPVEEARAQQPQPSEADVVRATNATVVLANHLSVGVATAADYASAIAAVQAMESNWGGVAFTSYLTNEVINVNLSTLSLPPTTADAVGFYSAVAQTGYTGPSSVIENAIEGLTPAQMAQGQRGVLDLGVAYILDTAIQLMQDQENLLIANQPNSGKLALALFPGSGHAAIREAVSSSSSDRATVMPAALSGNLCALAAVIGLYLATIGAMLYFGIITAPIGGILQVLGLLFAVLAVLCI